MTSLAEAQEIEQNRRLALRDISACEECGRTGPDVRLRGSMTAYHFDGDENSDDNPNRSWMGCQQHAVEYEEHWSAMWAEYHNSRG